MQDQGAALEPQQQVLGAPSDREDALAGQLRGHVPFDRPAQPVIVDAQLLDALPVGLALDAAARGFDLG